jgi:hypothetical protein
VLSVDGEVVSELDLAATGADPEDAAADPDNAAPGSTPTIRFEPAAPFARGVHRITVVAAGDGRVTAASLLLKAG